MGELKEGVDYIIEDGLWVFTEAYHRKRGYCCGNACRHCPYGHSAVKKPLEDESESE